MSEPMNPGGVSMQIWINLTGPATEPLKKAFFGPSVTVLQKNMKTKTGANGETTEAGNKKQKMLRRIKPETEPPTMICMAGAAGGQKYIRVQKLYRIVLLGDTKAGKNSLANTIFGEDVFKVDNTECQTESKSVHGRRITLINTPDFSGPCGSEDERKIEILKYITECSPGPHAFLIVLKVDTFTKQQQAVIEKISHHFSEEILKYAAVVFTREDQHSEEMKTEELIVQNKCLSDLIMKFKGRYHFIDNKYNQPLDSIRNQSQAKALLNTVDQIVKENKGKCYTSKMLPQGDSCKKANNSVYDSRLINFKGRAAESMANAFFGPSVVVLTPGKTNAAQTKIKQGVRGALESMMGALFAIFFGLTKTGLEGAVAFKIRVITAFKAALATGVAAGRVIQKGRNKATWVIGALRQMVDETCCFFSGLKPIIVTMITPLTALNNGVQKAAAWTIQNVGNIKHLVAAVLGTIVVNSFGLFLQLGITILWGGTALTVRLITTLRRTLVSGDGRAGAWVQQKAIKILEWVSQRGRTVAELTVRLKMLLETVLNTVARWPEVFVMQNVYNLTEWARVRLGSIVRALFVLVSWLKRGAFGLGVTFTSGLIRRFQTSLNFGATGTRAWIIQKVSQVIEWIGNCVSMRGALFGLFLGLKGAVYGIGAALAVGIITAFKTALFPDVTGAGAWVTEKVKNLVEWVMDKASTVLHLLGSGFGSMVSASFGSFLHFGKRILGSGATLIVKLTKAVDIGGATRAAAWTIQNVRRIKNSVAAGLGSTVGDPFVFFLRLGITLVVVECVCNGVQSITGALFGLILGSIATMLWDQLVLTEERIRALENTVFRSHIHSSTSKPLCRIHTHQVRKHGGYSPCLFVKIWRNNIKVWSSTNNRSDDITKNSSKRWSSTCKCFDKSNNEKNTKLGPVCPDGGVSLCVPFRLRRSSI